MEYLTSGLSGQSYHLGQPLAAVGEGFHRGFAGTQEVTLRIAAAQTAAVAQLRAEATLLDRLAHPQIVRVRDRGRTPQTYFLVLDEPAERVLADLIQPGDLSPTVALDIVVQVCDIVAALHAAGIAWGRLRPQAFWVDRAGRLKLADLRGAGQPIGDTPLTMAEATYLSPELGGGQPPSAPGDVYACGVLAYELLAGHPPFIGASPTELVVKHLVEPAPDLLRTRPGLPPDLTALVARCLSKDLADRPASLAVLTAELGAIQARLQAEERGRMVVCPRCQGRILPTARCPLCNAPLNLAPAAPPQRRKLLPLAAIGLSCVVLLCMLVAIVDREGGAAASAPTATATPAATTAHRLPTAVPPLPPTATAVPGPAGTVTSAAGDVADPNIDLIAARVRRDQDSLAIELTVVGRVDAPATQRVYQVFLDTDGPASGDRQTPWAALAADYAILYRANEEVAMVLQWNGSAWQGVGTASVAINGATLAVRAPAAWAHSGPAISYGALAITPDANLADYIPARASAGASVVDL